MRLTGSKSSKSDLVNTIVRSIGEISLDVMADRLMPYCLMKKKEWLALRVGTVPHLPQGEDPAILATTRGEETWYGPIKRLDDSQDASWYIYPKYFEHYEKDANGKVQECEIRWLCFGRIQKDCISLHWRGFSLAEEEGLVTDTKQFKYWEHVPKLFEDIIERTGARVKDIEPHKLFLYDLWDQYRDQPQVTWRHRRIRAESSDVSFKAHAGGMIDIEAKDGILDFAQLIRGSIEKELKARHGIDIPDVEDIDQTIVMTILRDLGTLSYEFVMHEGNQPIFRAHNYFGLKKASGSADSFAHHKLFLSVGELTQLEFLLRHVRR
jgi:hypothetical protein